MNRLLCLRARIILSLVPPLLLMGCGDEPAPTADPTDVGTDKTPPGPEVVAPPVGVVVLNEISARGDLGDWIELFNPEDGAVDIGGWRLTDEDPTHVVILGEGRRIEAGEHLLLLRDDPGGFAFGLGKGDAVSLFDVEGILVDWVSWSSGDAPNGLSYGRIPDGDGAFVTLETPTPGAANQPNATSVCGDGIAALDEVCDDEDLKGLVCEAVELTGTGLGCAQDCQSLDTSGCPPLSRLIVINEVSSSGDDPIELYNPGQDEVDLGGWRLTDEKDAPSAGAYFFSTGSRLEPGEHLLLTKGADHAFGLGGKDEVRLRDTTGLLVDRVSWSKGEAEISWCRIPDGTGEPGPCTQTSFGTSNGP